MKTRLLPLFLIVPLFLITTSVSFSQDTRTCLGKWTFEAPTAPSGYTYGKMDVKKDSVILTFTDDNLKYPSSWVKTKADSLIFSTMIDGEDVHFSLKMKDRDNIGGEAVWSGGETEMIIRRKEK